MNDILSVGVILLAALAAGHLAQRVRVPEVSGYLLVGALIGPSALQVVTENNVQALQFLSEVALGLILFSIGTIFEADTLRRLGPRVMVITLAEAGCAFVLVSLGMMSLGLSVSVACLLGVIAMETAPATTLMVLHEYDARGPLTDTLVALVAFNNMVVLTTFGVITAIVGFFGPDAGRGLDIVYSSTYNLFWGVVGSLALGAVLGLVLDAWSSRVAEAGEAMTLSLAVILVAVGGARWLELSPLFVTLAIGATMVNASRRSDEFVEALKRADPPLYAAFFVLAGAELRPDALAGVGVIGLAYVVLRVVGKVGGTQLAGQASALPPHARRYLGLCLISSSSLAIGLTIQVRTQFPDLAATLTSIVLAGVLVFEMVGPPLTRMALIRTGEAKTRPDLLPLT